MIIIHNFSVYPEDLKVTGNISLPRLVMSGEYVVIGEFQMLPVESTGMLEANFSKSKQFNLRIKNT